MTFEQKLLQFLKENVDSDGEYINPHFLQEINEAIYTYYDVEDEDLDAEIVAMFER